MSLNLAIHSYFCELFKGKISVRLWYSLQAEYQPPFVSAMFTLSFMVQSNRKRHADEREVKCTKSCDRSWVRTATCPLPLAARACVSSYETGLAVDKSWDGSVLIGQHTLKVTLSRTRVICFVSAYETNQERNRLILPFSLFTRNYAGLEFVPHKHLLSKTE